MYSNFNQLQIKGNTTHETCWYLGCECEDDLPDIYSGCNETCIRYLEMKHLMEHSNLPAAKQTSIHLNVCDADYDSYVLLNKLGNNIEKFVQDGKNLFLCSKSPGVGKTSWAIKLLHKYFTSIWYGNALDDTKCRGLFVSVPALISQSKDFSSPDMQRISVLKEAIMCADVVIWDDIGCSGLSGFDYSNIFYLLDYRINSELCNIFTSNLTTKEEISEKYGDSLASRIWNTSYHIEFYGDDKRMQGYTPTSLGDSEYTQ